jgi:hypothetical protein
VNLDDSDRACAWYCVVEVINNRRFKGQPVPDWLLRYHDRLNLALSKSGQDLEAVPAQSEQLITAAEAATMLNCSARKAKRLAADLDGQNIGGRWLFNRAVVREYARRKASA